MDGIILIDKPQGATSHDMVAEARKILNFKKIGHFGTLDPLATGLLVLAAGKATRLFPFFSREDKVYEGSARLGHSTDTYDSEGRPTSPEKTEFPPEQPLTEALKKFEGTLLQKPPSYSAKKHMGKPLYKLARAHQEVPLKPSQVFVHSFQIRGYRPPFLDFEVKCSSGTYIRSLVHDLGRDLGCGAHLTALRRISSGRFRLKDARSMPEVRGLSEAGDFEKFLIPMEILLPEFPKVILDETGSRLAGHGQAISAEHFLKVISTDPTLPEGQILRLFSPSGRLLALARRKKPGESYHPFVVLM
jgi:tRNA pseudouridine55 synthase